MEEVPTNNNTDAKVVACLLGDSNNKVARYNLSSRSFSSMKQRGGGQDLKHLHVSNIYSFLS